MKKLTKEDIQFIDRYLKSEITFTDIRIEMVDHVASAIEQMMNDGDERVFYYVFKDYMVENKKLILKKDRKFLRSIDNKIGKRLLRNVFSIKGIVVFLVVFSFFNMASSYLESQQFFKVFKFTPMIVLGVIGLIYFFGIKRTKERYSAIERIGIFFFLFFQFANIVLRFQNKSNDFIYENILLMNVIATFLITLIVMLLFIAVQYKNEYQLKFKTNN